MTLPVVDRRETKLAPADASPPVFALFQQALDKGAEGAGAMETLYKLYVAEREHTARLAFAHSMSDFQSRVKVIPKTSKAKILTKAGGSFEYSYAGYEEIVEHVGPIARECGFSYTFDTEMKGERMDVAIRVMHIEGHVERSTFALPTSTQSAMSAQQAVGAALTFAKRYLLIAAFGLVVGDPDPDGAADPTTITESQAADLKTLAESKGAILSKVLAYAGADSFESIRVSDYQRTLTALKNWGAK